MQKVKFKLLFLVFIAILLGAKSILSMENENTVLYGISYNKIDLADCDKQEANECPVCFEIMNTPSTLVCNHQFCALCIDKIIAKANSLGNRNQLTCPLCRQEFKVRSSPHMGLKIIMGGLTAYALYRYTKNKRNLNDQSVENVQESLSNQILKQTSAIKQRIAKPAVVISGLVSVALFTLLEEKGVNLAIPVKLFLEDRFRETYWSMTSMGEKNIFLRAIKNQFDNGRLINACLSLAGGLLGGYAYKILNGKDLRSKKRHSVSPMPKTSENDT